MSDQPATPWPNQTPIVDGVTPEADVPQDPNLFADDDLSFLDEEGDR
ncbi:hypothetical protein [Phycicoccus avicenniae]